MANYYETDQMGVVHHSNHIRYFEEARAEMEKDGIIIPNVDAYAKYEKPVRFADRVSIAVRLVKFSGATMRYEYTMRLPDGSTAATGHTTHCFVGKGFKPLSLKHKYPAYYEKLKAHVFE